MRTCRVSPFIPDVQKSSDNHDQSCDKRQAATQDTVQYQLLLIFYSQQNSIAGSSTTLLVHANSCESAIPWFYIAEIFFLLSANVADCILYPFLSLIGDRTTMLMKKYETAQVKHS